MTWWRWTILAAFFAAGALIVAVQGISQADCTHRGGILLRGSTGPICVPASIELRGRLS